MGDVADKLAYFQAITGISDPDLSTEILSAHNWDLELAISSITSNNPSSSASPSTTGLNQVPEDTGGLVLPPDGNNQPPGLAWKLITLPFSIVSTSLGLISGVVGFGLWAAGGILSYSLGAIGLNAPGRGGGPATPLVSVSQSAAEALEFVSSFERDYVRGSRPNFVAESFMDALQRSRHEYKLLFVYLHSPEHPDTQGFCERTLCSEMLAAFLNENFVCWGGSVKASEGFKMSNSLKASRFPFCAVVMAATNQRIALLQQVCACLRFSSSVVVTMRMELYQCCN